MFIIKKILCLYTIILCLCYIMFITCIYKSLELQTEGDS